MASNNVTTIATIAIIGLGALVLFRKPVSDVIDATASGVGDVASGVGDVFEGTGEAFKGTGSAISSLTGSYADFGGDILSVSNPLKATTDKISDFISNTNFTNSARLMG